MRNEPHEIFGHNEIEQSQPIPTKQLRVEPRTMVLQRLISSPDILEDDIERLGQGEDYDSLLEMLLRDQTKGCHVVPNHIVNSKEQFMTNYKSHHHIVWATDNYNARGDGYLETDEIEADKITHRKNRIVRPRAVKSKAEQQRRIKQKAEVFTPSWVCNKQNNLIDEAWFGRKDVFNHENDDHTWTTTTDPIAFSSVRGRTWLDYVTERRIEICCGEAPYLVSRYDTTTGQLIPLHERIGLLDRKLRVVGENVQTLEKWREYAYKALRSIYAFEYQGDNLLIARENIFVSFIEYYYDFCCKIGVESEISTVSLHHVAYIISWNIFQMDGLTYLIPYSNQESQQEQSSIDFDNTRLLKPRPEGIYARTARWTGDGRQKYLIPFEFRKLIITNSHG